MFKTSEYGNTVLNVEFFEVVRIGAYFHYVNHQAGLCSVGFGSLQNLLKYSDCIRADQPALRKMVERYMELFIGDMMNNEQLPIHFDKRTLPIIKTFHGNATISGVDFSNSFVDAGFTYVEVRFCLIDEAYHHSNFFIGHFKRDFVERILDQIDILNSSKQTS